MTWTRPSARCAGRSKRRPWCWRFAARACVLTVQDGTDDACRVFTFRGSSGDERARFVRAIQVSSQVRPDVMPSGFLGKPPTGPAAAHQGPATLAWHPRVARGGVGGPQAWSLVISLLPAITYCSCPIVSFDCLFDAAPSAPCGLLGSFDGCGDGGRTTGLYWGCSSYSVTCPLSEQTRTAQKQKQKQTAESGTLTVEADVETMSSAFELRHQWSNKPRTRR